MSGNYRSREGEEEERGGGGGALNREARSSRPGNPDRWDSLMGRASNLQEI